MAATVDNDAYATATAIDFGVLRNGVVADLGRTARESSIAAKYYFSAPRYVNAWNGNPGGRIPACPAAIIIQACIRSAYATLVAGQIDEADAAHNAGAAGAAFNEAAARAAAEGSAANRLEAIAIGSARAALVASYRIEQADLRETESEGSLLVLTAPDAADDDAAYRVLAAGTTRGWTIALASGNAVAAMDDDEACAINMAPMTQDESDFSYVCFVLGQAAGARAGAELFISGHHYLSDASSSARHRAIENEVLGEATTAVKQMWRASTEMLRNAVWHASVHPIKTTVLENFASDPDTPAKLDATGYGSMSVGLPAQEDLFNRAGSFIAVYNQIRTTASAHGHTLSIADLEATVIALRNLPHQNVPGAVWPAQRPALPGNPAGAWPDGCNTRAKALKTFLEPALVKAEPVAAWMFGFYREICSRAGIRQSSQEGSLLRSYSLKRALQNNIAEANRALEMYSARARYIRAEGEKGNLESYTGEC